MSKVAVIMGSISDYDIVAKAVDILEMFSVPYQARVLSAHRTPNQAAEFASKAEQNGFSVIIAAAGKAAHLAGVLAAHTTVPVIGIPIQSSALDGLDALLSTVQMPPGVPVATVGINGAENAALLAVQILALNDGLLKEKLKDYRLKMEKSVEQKDIELQKKLQERLNTKGE